MRRVGIVAKREFLQIARTRSFWITLLLVPVLTMVMPLFGQLMRPPATNIFFVADASGRYERAIAQRNELADSYDVLYDFARYAQTWNLKAKSPDAVWDKGERPFNDDEVRAFKAAGGVEAALKEAGPLPQGAPPFRPEPPAYVQAEIPNDVPVDQGAEAFGTAIARYMLTSRDKPKGYRGAVAAIYIPADYGAPGVQARIWTSGGAFNLVDRVRRVLNEEVRNDMARAAGVDPVTAAKLQTASAPLLVSSPPRGQGRERIALQSALPLGIAYFLLISVFTSGAWLLQGVLEERSNKLLEAMLACVSPNELMYGKLLGIVGIGFSVIIVWGACFAIGAAFLPSAVSQTILPAMSSLNTPWLIAALGFYFVTGYLICATLFLAVGAVSESMQDAQAYLSPISLALFLPFFLLGSLIGNPDALPPKILSWIPFYTPYAMMARIGVGVETWEVIGTSALLVAFIVFELWFLGRVFRNNLLRTGQPPKLAALFRGLVKPSVK